MARYSIAGIGKLGASMAAAIASRGFDVVAVDTDPRKVAQFNAGLAPVEETDLAAFIAANRSRLRATLDFRDAICNSETTFIVVPTPSDADGAFSLVNVARACEEIGRALAAKSSYHNVVLTSTVLPGATRYGLLPLLEARSGKRCGPDFGLCYNPEFVALGSVIRDFLNPDFVLIGEFDERAGSNLARSYAEILGNGSTCKRMSPENAELTKIALNSYVTTKITFANTLAALCERVPGGDVDMVSDALGLDTRIGRRYLTGGLGYGGPCFPRDNAAFGFVARALGCEAPLADATDRQNRGLADALVARLRPLLVPDTKVAVLGLAYKPQSNVVEESQAASVAVALAKAGAHVVAFDPLARDTARAALGDSVRVEDSLQACLARASVVVVATADPVFRRLVPADLAECARPTAVVDPWRIVAAAIAQHQDIRYLPGGRSTEDQENSARLEALWSRTASGAYHGTAP